MDTIPYATPRPRRRRPWPLLLAVAAAVGVGLVLLPAGVAYRSHQAALAAGRAARIAEQQRAAAERARAAAVAQIMAAGLSSTGPATRPTTTPGDGREGAG